MNDKTTNIDLCWMPFVFPACHSKKLSCSARCGDRTHSSYIVFIHVFCYFFPGAHFRTWALWKFRVGFGVSMCISWGFLFPKTRWRLSWVNLLPQLAPWTNAYSFPETWQGECEKWQVIFYWSKYSAEILARGGGWWNVLSFCCRQ